MAPKPDGSLSELARRLLATERNVAEPEAVKTRAIARARASFEAHRLSSTSTRRAFWLFGARGAARLPRIALPAAALALAGLAAAAANLMSEGTGGARYARQAFSVAATVRPAPSALPLASTRVADVFVSPSTVSPDPAPSTAQRRSSATPNRRSSVRQYAVELELLEPARHAIAGGNYRAALDAVARHERDFPSGQLAEERSALRVRALWASGRRSEAQVAAERFRRSYPRSGLLNWMPERAP